MTDLSDAQLNDMFQSLDLRQLEELGYVIDSQSPDQLEDFLITIEEEFSDLDRNEKIAELKKVGLDEVQFDAEETKREREEYGLGAESKTLDYTGNFSGSHDGVDYDVSYECSHDIDTSYEAEIRDYVEAQISNGYDSGYESFQMSTGFYEGEIEIEGTVTWESIETLDAETKRQRMKREKEEAAMDAASMDVDYMREHYSESDAYIYAYNDGHSDARSNTVNYRPSASDRELTSFKKIFKQAEFAADSPFNTLLLIREDIIIDDEEDFDRLLSVYMSLETDIAQLYQETSNPKHPLLGEMMRYRNRIANRLDELQEEVAIQDTIEMDAEFDDRRNQLTPDGERDGFYISNITDEDFQISTPKESFLHRLTPLSWGLGMVGAFFLGKKL